MLNELYRKETHMLTVKRTLNSRRLITAGYWVLSVIAVLAALTACKSSSTVTSTPTLTVAATTQRITPTAPGASPTPPASPSPAPTAIMTPSPVATPTASLPWAGKVAPGQPAPGEVVRSITSSWQAMWNTLYDYPSVKANGKPDDKAWWTDQARRFFTGAALTEQIHNIEGWFEPGASDGPGFIENGRTTVTVKQCTSDTECLVDIHVRSGQWWAYDVAEKQFDKANAVQSFQWRVVMQYDAASGQWKFQDLVDQQSPTR